MEINMWNLNKLMILIICVCLKMQQLLNSELLGHEIWTNVSAYNFSQHIYYEIEISFQSRAMELWNKEEKKVNK